MLHACIPPEINAYRFSYHLKSRRCSQGSGSGQAGHPGYILWGQPDQTPENRMHLVHGKLVPKFNLNSS